MNVLLIAGIVVGGIVLVTGGIFIWLWLFGRKKFPFIIYSKNGITHEVVYATVKKDPKNKSIKKFAFTSTDTTLDISPPTFFLGKDAYREAAYDDLNELKYITGHKIDKENYINKSLVPEEKQIALFRYKENTVRYENPLDKVNAGIILSGFVLILLLLVGIIYVTINYVNLTSDWATIVTEQKEISKNHERAATMQKDAIELQTQVIAGISQELNITRKLS